MALIATSGFELAAGGLGVLAAGRALVPIDPRLGVDAARDALAALGVGTLLATLPDAASFAPAGTQVIRLDEVDPSPPAPRFVHEDEPAMYGFTSGTTGAPKIAPTRYGELARRITRTGPAVITQDDRAGMLLGATSGALRRMIEAFGRGVTVTCLDARVVSSEGILAAFARDDVSFLWMIPTYLRRLVAQAQDRVNLPSLRVIVTSGEPLHWRDVDLVRRRLSPRCAIRHPYGSTEAGSIAVRLVDPDEPLGEGVVPVGLARDGVRISIIDPAGERVPDGHPGEIVVESALVRAADPDGTSEDGIALRRTGDFGRVRPDGQVELLGRVDRMVKIGGIRAQPARVEHELRALDWIDEVAVVPRAQEGDAQPALVAHIVTSVADGEAAMSRIRDHLAPRVHPAEVPQAIVVHTERLPTLATGKVDTVALQRRTGATQRD